MELAASLNTLEKSQKALFHTILEVQRIAFVSALHRLASSLFDQIYPPFVTFVLIYYSFPFAIYVLQVSSNYLHFVHVDCELDALPCHQSFIEKNHRVPLGYYVDIEAHIKDSSRIKILVSNVPPVSFMPHDRAYIPCLLYSV